MPRLNSDHFCRHTDHFLRPIRVEVSIISVSTQTRHAADTVLSRKTFVWGHFLFLPGGSLPSYCTMHHFYTDQTHRHSIFWENFYLGAFFVFVWGQFTFVLYHASFLHRPDTQTQYFLGKLLLGGIFCFCLGAVYLRTVPCIISTNTRHADIL